MSQSAPSPLEPNPRAQLRELMAGYFLSHAVYVAARLNIATLLADGPKTCAALAAACGAHSDTLYRLLRALASYGVFAEDEQQRFANTPKSEPLRADIPASMRPMALFFGDETMVTPWHTLLHSVTSGKPAFEHVYGMHHFDYMARHADKAKVFDDAMVSLSAAVNAALVKGYDFSPFASIIDIAGGYGSTLCTILRANPGLRGILFDMPHVIEGARAYIATQGLAERCDVVGGDFFQSVPAGAGAYFMKHIIHDWDDERCVKLLRTCHAAMPARAKLLVCERIVPPGNAPAYSKVGDLVMLIMTPGGRERTLEQYRTLFEGGGFRLDRVVATESEFCVIEGEKL